MGVFEEFEYSKCLGYLSKREVADELKFLAKEKEQRIFIELTDRDLENIDQGFALFKKYFDVPLEYRDFKENKITVGKQSYKLFKYIFQNKEFIEKYGIEKMKVISEEIGRYKFPNEKLYFCISLNYNDFLLASTKNNWTSCINLENGDYKRTVFGTLFNKGMFITFITDLSSKEYKDLKSYKMFLRSFGFVEQSGKLMTTLYYPLRTNFEFSKDGIELKNPQAEVKSKYNFDIVYNDKRAFVFPYIDKGKIIKYGNNYCFVTGCVGDRYEAKVVVDDKLLSFDDYYFFGSEKGRVKKHCDICDTESGFITTINGINYCRDCLPNHKEVCSRCGETKSCRIDDKNKYICDDCMTAEDNICPVCGTVFPKTRMHTCKFCRSKHLDAFGRYMFYDKKKDNTYTYSKHLLLKEGDIELADDTIIWDDAIGEYTKKEG